MAKTVTKVTHILVMQAILFMKSWDTRKLVSLAHSHSFLSTSWRIEKYPILEMQ